MECLTLLLPEPFLHRFKNNFRLEDYIKPPNMYFLKAGTLQNKIVVDQFFLSLYITTKV